MIQQKKTLIITLAILLILFFTWVIYLLIPKSYILLQTAPDTVMVKINGDDRQVKNGERISVSPGKYKLIFFRDEFNPQTETFDLKNGETKEIVAALVPLTEKAKNILFSSDESLKVLEKATATRIDAESKILEKTYPILKILPIETRSYSILTCRSKKFPNEPNKVALCIDVIDISIKESVENSILSQGYNLNDYEVIWRDLSF